MNIILFFTYLIINLSLYSSLNNPDNLPSDYPFSVKKDTNTAVIFSNNYITLFDVTQTTIPQDPLISKILIDCPSTEEKGGTYFEGNYYTSCLNPADNTEFQIKVYDSSFTLTQTYPTSVDYFQFSSTIRFFKLTSVVEAIWLNNGLFNLAKFDNTEIKKHTTYPLTRAARDTDCIFIPDFNRIVCAFGVKEKEESETFSCSANIFTIEDALISNLKIWNVCNNHQSRKLKLDNENTKKFYYYFVDTNFDAYILPLTMTASEIIENGNAIKVMSGCDESQTSFDLAEDKFNGYFAFTCVEGRFKRTIKIQLFKINDNNEIVFYEDKNVDNTFVFPDEEADSDFSMVNFIVLKSSLNFGFLSYRLLSTGGQYTIFNQPECENYLVSYNTQDLFQNKIISLDFTRVMKNDNYAGGRLEIVEQGEGMEVSVLSPGDKIEFISKDYITGELSFTFRVINTFYKSEICTAYIKVNECFIHCETCSITSDNFYAQECENGCKEGSYPMVNFPNTYNSNCCEKDVDCPDYFYLNYNQYEICNIACLDCKGSTEYNCVSCYNEKELEKYSNEEVGYISTIKSLTSSLYYYWENEEHKKCVINLVINLAKNV